jgi:hypothetical protein
MTPALSSLLLCLALLLSLVMFCRAGRTSPSSTSTNSPSSSAPASSNRSDSSLTPNFATTVVCSLPKQVARNTPFADLGGGTWGKWGDSGGELDYGCNGGQDSITLRKDGGVHISAEYGAIGGAEIPHYISVEYTAFQYNGQTGTEKQLRRQYADFCDKLSEKLYGLKLPQEFRKRLLDESTYSSTDTANEYAQKIGNGYANLSSSKKKSMMIMLDIHFFSSEVEYKTYKDE